jgi:hypothetical protein
MQPDLSRQPQACALRVAISDVRDYDSRVFRRLLDIFRQQAAHYGHQDPDPDHDCVGLCITAGTQHDCAFMPFGE